MKQYVGILVFLLYLIYSSLSAEITLKWSADVKQDSFPLDITIFKAERIHSDFMPFVYLNTSSINRTNSYSLGKIESKNHFFILEIRDKNGNLIDTTFRSSKKVNFLFDGSVKDVTVKVTTETK